MKRFTSALLLIVFVFCSITDAQRRSPRRTPARRAAPASDCPRVLRDINDCPDQGCGRNYDANMNLQKNLTTSDQAPVRRTLAFMKELGNPINFRKGDTREEIAALGEGENIVVVAYALVARRGSPESCNCGLSAQKDADNHIVLVEEETLELTARATRARPATATRRAVRARTARENTLIVREKQSITAEFTPRVRLDHPQFVRTNLQSRIDAAPRNALLVRVTGLLFFDSEHFRGHPLERVNNWEIHPVLKMEFCETGNTCTAGSDRGWKSLDDLP